MRNAVVRVAHCPPWVIRSESLMARLNHAAVGAPDAIAAAKTKTDA